jgi:hypothetical protein
VRLKGSKEKCWWCIQKIVRDWHKIRDGGKQDQDQDPRVAIHPRVQTSALEKVGKPELFRDYNTCCCGQIWNKSENILGGFWHCLISRILATCTVAVILYSTNV